MFKSGRWRNEKSKFKAVFKLQFHATQLEQVEGDALIISLVPADVGKPTVRLEKAAIRDGSCYWETPVYEAVKLFQEPKSGKIQEKTYYFVISTGSSKAGLVGEVSIDFASYAESNKPSSVCLPLKNTKCGAILHVSIQRLPENIDQRYPEQTENAKNNLADRSSKTQSRNNDTAMKIESNSTKGSIQRLPEKSDQRCPDQIKDAKLNSADGSAKTHSRDGDADTNINSNPSEVSSHMLPGNIGERDAEQTENAKNISTDRSLKIQRRNGDADVINTSSNSTEDGPSTNKIPHIAGSNGNRRASSGSDITVTSSESSSGVDTPIQFLCPGEAISEDKSQQALESMIEKLRSELTSLSRVADLSELELQSLRKQIAKERKRGQDLSREVVTLREERDAFKEKCEKHMDEPWVETKMKLQGGHSFAFVEELRQELKYEKEMNANLQLQLQKMQESNAELILALRDLDIMVEQKDKEFCNLSNLLERFQENMSQLKMGDDEENRTLEELVLVSGNTKEPDLPDQKSIEGYSELQRFNDLEMRIEQLSLDYEILKQENAELSYKLEQSRVQEQLKMQYECSSPYEIVNELESNIENLESELKKRSNECLESLATVTKLERQIKGLEEELEKQGQAFEADLDILIGAKVEQEQRAIRAEATLKKMQWQSLGTVERLQDELRKVLVEVAFTLEENEKMTIEAETEAIELRLQISYLKEFVSKAKEEIHSVSERYEAELNDMAPEIEHGQNHGEKTQRVLSQEILMLKAEIGRLDAENNTLRDEVQQIESLKCQLVQMKTAMEEKEMMLRRGNMERTDSERMIDLLRKDAEMLTEELNLLRGLKDEKELVIGRLEKEKNVLYVEVQRIESFKDDLEQMKTLMEEKEMMLQRGNMERNDLESKMDLLRKDAEMLKEEVNLLRHFKDEKELVIARLQAENNTLRDEVQWMEPLKDELEHVKTSMEEKEMMLQRGNMERNDLESTVDLLRKDDEMLLEELNLLRGLNKEKELVIGRLESENNTLHDQVQRTECPKDELEQIKKSMAEKETMLQRGSMKRNELESNIDLLMKDVKMLTEELHLLRGLKGEKELVIERLKKENDALHDELQWTESLKDELEQMKTSMEEKEMMLRRGNMERNDLESMINSFRNDAEMLKEELNLLRGLKDEKETTIGSLETENNSLRDEVQWMESLKDELEQMKTSMEEKEMMLRRGNMERNDLESMNNSFRKDAEMLKEELNLLRGLKDEKETTIGRLETENNSLRDEVQWMESLKDELEQMKTSMEEKEMMLRRGNMERNDLESMNNSFRKDAEMLKEELNLLRGLKDEKETTIGRLETENNSLRDEVQWMESLKDELEQMKTSMEEKEMMLRRGNMERNDLESMNNSFRKDAEMLKEELILLRGLKDEKETTIGRLETENNSLRDEVQWVESLKDELEQMKTSMEEKEMMLRRGNMERNDLESMINSFRKDAEMLKEELNLLRGLKDEKELVIGNLKLELDTLKSKCNKSDHCLFKNDFEEEELRNQASQVNGDLHNEEGAFSNLKKQQTRDNETYFTVIKDPEVIASNGSIPEDVKNWSVMPMIISCSEDCEVSPAKEVEASIFSTSHEGCVEELLKEVELLREKNKSMEGELKQMQERYSDISLKFAEVEGERQRLVMTVNRKNRKKS